MNPADDSGSEDETNVQNSILDEQNGELDRIVILTNDAIDGASSDEEVEAPVAANPNTTIEWCGCLGSDSKRLWY